MCTTLHTLYLFFFFNDPATTEIYTLSLHDALPIYSDTEIARMLLDRAHVALVPGEAFGAPGYLRLSYATSLERIEEGLRRLEDRKSTRLNSSHGYISYAVFCLKKKKQTNYTR